MYQERIQAIKDRASDWNDMHSITTDSGPAGINLATAQVWLRRHGQWERSQYYLSIEELPVDLWPDVVVAQAHLAEAWASRQTNEVLLAGYGFRTGDILWIATAAEAERRSLL